MIGFRGGQSLATLAGTFRGPLHTLKMCLAMTVTYDRFWSERPVTIRSGTFQWPALPGDNRWVEGLAIPHTPDAPWIPEGSTVGAVWGVGSLYDRARQSYAPGALQCSRIDRGEGEHVTRKRWWKPPR